MGFLKVIYGFCLGFIGLLTLVLAAFSVNAGVTASIGLPVRLMMFTLGGGAFLAGVCLLSVASRELGFWPRIQGVVEAGEGEPRTPPFQNWSIVLWLGMIFIVGSLAAASVFPVLLIYLVVSQYILVGFHEFGHVAAAWLIGIRPSLVKIGTGREILGLRCGSIRVSIGLSFFSGYVLVDSGGGQWTRKKSLIFSLGGPLASALTFAGGLWICYAADFQSSFSHIVPLQMFVAVFAAQHLLIFLGSFASEVVIDGLKMKPDMTAILEDLFISNERWELLHKRRAQEAAEQTVRASWSEAWKQDAPHLLPLPQYAAYFANVLIWVGKDAAPKLEKLVDETLSGSRPGNEELCYLLFARAGCLAYRGETVVARACLNEAVETAATDQLKVTLYEYAASLVIVTRLMEFLPNVDRYSQLALQLQPEEITLKGTRGSILVEMDLILDGVKMLQEVFEQSKSDNDKIISAFYLALACLKAGDLESAHSWRDKMMRLQPPAWLVARAGDLGSEVGNSHAETNIGANKEPRSAV